VIFDPAKVNDPSAPSATRITMPKAFSDVIVNGGVVIRDAN
jgi:hypothetical protein